MRGRRGVIVRGERSLRGGGISERGTSVRELQVRKVSEKRERDSQMGEVSERKGRVIQSGRSVGGREGLLRGGMLLIESGQEVEGIVSERRERVSPTPKGPGESYLGGVSQRGDISERSREEVSERRGRSSKLEGEVSEERGGFNQKEKRS